MLRFTKMQSLGNDFVLIDGVRQPFQLEFAQIRRLAHRKTGIGFDQLLVAEPGRNGTDFSMRVFNTDGSEAEQCGNGARCFAKFLLDQGLTERNKLVVQVVDRVIGLEIEERQVIVDMGDPIFEPSAIPFNAVVTSPTYELDVGGEMIEILAVSFGNPHAVLMVKDVETAEVDQVGPLIENHPRFPNRTNVGFVEPCTRSKIRLRVWERGVGETLACGTGACAATVACRRLGLVDDEIEVELPGGIAKAMWTGAGSVFLSGPADTVYEGRFDPNRL